MMKTLELSGKQGKGKYVLLDDEDHELLSKFKWWFNQGYAYRTKTRGKKNDGSRDRISLFMHKFILNSANGLVTDHINGNRLDNRKQNLRLATYSQNLVNRRGFPNELGYNNISLQNKYRYKTPSYMVRFSIENKTYCFGSFPTPHLAALAADLWGYDLHGKFYKPNFKRVALPELLEYIKTLD